MAVLDDWLEVLRDAQYSGTLTKITDVAIGTGTTAVTSEDTELESEVVRGTATLGKSGDHIISYITTFSTAQANGSSITEAGAINAPTLGCLCNRKVFPAFEKTSNYSLRVSVFVRQDNNL